MSDEPETPLSPDTGHPDRPVSLGRVRASTEGAELIWHHNRAHYHPRVIRLNFQGFDLLGPADLSDALAETLTELTQKTASLKPLLFRTTVASHSPLLPALSNHGFLQTRHVYEPALRLDERLTMELSRWRDPVVKGGRLRVTTFSENPHQSALADLAQEVYQRTSRLDPATPNMLEPGELWGALLDGLNPDISSCAFIQDELVGIGMVYASGKPEEVELGLIGVLEKHLPSHQEITLAMLTQSIDNAIKAGTTRLAAEVDSDDPWTLYTLADLPFEVADESISLVWPPRWNERT